MSLQQSQPKLQLSIYLIDMLKRLNDSFDANDPLQLIEARFHDIKKLWDVKEKHEKYMEALEGSKGEYDASAEDEWINALDGVYKSVQSQIHE